MLTENNLIALNKQIEKELSIYNSILCTDKEAVLRRIALLKNILEPLPSRSDILQELAEAIVDAQQKRISEDASDKIDHIFGKRNK